MNLILNLTDTLEESAVGGKAASLSKLSAFGVNVPPGFAVHKDVHQNFLQNHELPAEFIKVLDVHLAQQPAGQVIVRSSAIGEDSASHSFAGQLDSFVVRNDVDAVLAAIKNCWAGLQNDRVAAYQKVSGMRLEEMGVVIQSFIEADFAGVTFTKSPFNSNEMYTEYVLGAGEQLVSGKVNPYNFSCNGVKESLSQLPFNADDLISKSTSLKEAFGFDLDIEWVIADGKTYFVQARPITTIAAKETVHWSNTNLNENYPDPISPLLYSIARDSYYHYFKNLAGLLQINNQAIRMLEYDFSNTVGIWGGRLYYNMSSIHNILSSSPLKEHFKGAFNAFVGYQKDNVATQDSSGKTSKIKLVLQLIKLNLQLPKHVRSIEKMVSEFSNEVLNNEELENRKNQFYTFLDLRFNQWYHASLADFFAMIHYKLLGNFTKRFYGERSVGVHNTLIQAIPGLISGKPLNDTYAISALIHKTEGGLSLFKNNSADDVLEQIYSEDKWISIRQLIDNYIVTWGFRCSGELMFFKSNYVDEPVKFIELLQTYLNQTVQDPRKVIAHKDDERKKMMRAFAWKIIKKRHVFIPISMLEVICLYALAGLCKHAISSRERVRYKQAEMYFRFRQVVRHISKSTLEKNANIKPGDIFFLKYKEIGEFLSKSDMYESQLTDLIAQRKAQFELESQKKYPTSFSTKVGERPDNIPEVIEFEAAATEFTGLAASGGRIKAKVKVLEGILEIDKLEKGDILVTKQTDPGWAMAFPIIGGLIVERGGALSHGAIVAREFGLPAVIGIVGITEVLKDGDTVILDGDLGKIQLV